MYATNEATKENHTRDGNMVDNGGAAVRVATVKSVVSLLDMPRLGFNEMSEIKSTSFMLAGTTDVVYFHVAGFIRKGEEELVLQGAVSGTSVSIAIESTTGIGASAHYIVAASFNSNESVTLIETKGSKAASRRLDARHALAKKNPDSLEHQRGRRLIYSNMEELMEARHGEASHQRGRDLGFFSALMTSGSFTMMQAGSF